MSRRPPLTYTLLVCILKIKKTRPAVVVQNDPANRRSPITIVAAVSSQFEEPLYPTEVLVRAPEGGLTADSAVLVNQIP